MKHRSSQSVRDETTGRRSRRPVVAGTLAAALAAGVVASALVGNPPPSEPALSATSLAQSSSVPAHTPPSPVGSVPAATDTPVGRNPFKALYTVPAAGAAGTTTQAAPAGTASGATSGASPAAAGTGTVTNAPAPAAGTGTGSGASVQPQPPTAPKYLTVMSVDAVANQVGFRLVDRTVKDPAKAQQDVVVKPGEVFATYFKLLGYGTVLDANNQPRSCTDLQYGDNRIKLCVGESYQVG